MRISSVILDTGKTIRELVQALTNRLRFEDNHACVLIDVADTGSADTEFIVVHNLGVVPTHYVVNSSAGYVYDSDRANWTITEMKLKCSAPNATLKLVIFY